VVRKRAARSVDEQLQTVEHVQNAVGYLRCRVGEQPERWCARR
jgi:hypothetical protein